MKPGRYKKSLHKAWRRLQNRIHGGRRILVLGDSHCGVYEYCFDQGYLVPHLLNCEIVAGATAYGLNNDQSATMAWHRFDRALKRYRDFDVVLIMLGEVDCSYALWQKSERTGLPPEAFFDRCFAGLERLLQRVRSEGGAARKVIVAGASLPTIADQYAAVQENELRRSIAATQMQRTQLVLAYNACLAEFAYAHDVRYFDLTAETLDPETRLVARCYLAEPDDHHLSHPATGKLWAASLLRCL